MTIGPSRRFTICYLVASAAFAWVTVSDDWHAWVNDGMALTALSLAGGGLVAAVLIMTTRLRR